MVLNDGETYTDLEGCKIVVVSHEDFEDESFAVRQAFHGNTGYGRVVTVFNDDPND